MIGLPYVDDDPEIDRRRVAAAIVGLDPDAPDEESRDPTDDELDAWMRGAED